MRHDFTILKFVPNRKPTISVNVIFWLFDSVDFFFLEIYEILNRRTPIETFSVIVKLVYLELLSTPSLQRETIYGEKENKNNF